MWKENRLAGHLGHHLSPCIIGSCAVIALLADTFRKQVIGEVSRVEAVTSVDKSAVSQYDSSLTVAVL